jgi:catechol 2,3-dioxygenase-like lactoylglutathione lyase family enzyme
MITGTHAILYADDADAARAFFRDVLGLPYVDDGGGGWLIFRLPPAEAGIHPSDAEGATHGTHQLFLMCDDVTATVADLKAKGAEFEGDVADHGWGLLISLKVPGAGTIGLYQPRHALAPQD